MPSSSRASAAPLLSKRRAVAWGLVAALLGIACVLGTYRLAYRSAWDDLRQTSQRRLQFLSADLASALDKYNTLPLALAGHPGFGALLRHPSDAALRDEVNGRLEQLARDTHVTAIYLIDAKATTLAASNWNQPSSFVGQNYVFRPYFRDAVAQGIGRFYAVGATTGEPGYFLAHRVGPANAPLGVVAVKISLDEIEANWAKGGELLMLADSHGVVFLASRPEWKFHTLKPLPPDALQAIRQTQQYGGHSLEPLPIRAGRHGTTELALRAPNGDARWLRVAAEQHPLGHMGWTLLSFSEVDDIASLARSYAAAAGFAYAFVLVGLLYAGLRRRRDEERHQARRALERASAELEQRIAERTGVLVSANDELAAKIAELDRTQAALRATQNELIQAGKLTVLGQMAASITHEINQPLTALRQLNDNALVLLDRGDLPSVRENLQTNEGLMRRIAAIVAELKGFARKDEVRPSPVAVAPLLQAALALVAADARRSGCRIELPAVPPALAVQGQAVRIEQVLVNLLRNAMDACRERDTRLITVSCDAGDGWVSLAVADSGPGITPEALAHLFEPFFTTKPVGQGLGLGLAISASIANALGGTLSARNRPEGGALFTLRLRAAAHPELAPPGIARTIG